MFEGELVKGLIAGMDKNYTDNYDFYRFGPEPAAKNGSLTLKQRLVGLVNSKGYYNLSAYKDDFQKKLSVQLEQNREGIKHCGILYNLLADEQSKGLLVNLLCYHILGYKKVKLPLSKPQYWEQIKKIGELQDKSDTIKPGFMGFILYKTDLKPLGYPVKLYFTQMGIMTDFVVKQYEYKSGETTIKADTGNVVVDAGACWGDTALYFAAETGASGAVYSFEFIPTNIEIFNKNIALNPQLKDAIHVVKAPLWDVSGTKVFYRDNGPGSKISFTKEDDLPGETTTLTLDDWCIKENPAKIDFIKMDIEGAEMNALLGAEQTIRKFRPKLAICVYHQWQDFSRIATWINNLGLGYKFYLSHSTIHIEETVLFARA
ncbi:MAG TPA: FkbM family methyltransferase [Chitinophagales bacterium]|nr:FkbM family methyltransferase [Chitinophagales bacterium]